METGGERAHKVYSPSQSERFMLCHGSNNQIARTPPRLRTVYADEGTIAHEILEAGLNSGAQNAAEAIDASIYFAEPERFDNNFRASINDALDYIWDKLEFLQMMYGDAVLYVERYVDPPVASKPGEAGGYCDVCIYSAIGRILYVIDYKHGAGIAKAVIGNSQVKQYAAGFLFEENAAVNPAEIDEVVLVIIQPRAFHKDGDIREYRSNPAEMWAYLSELDDTITKCERPDAPLCPGTDQCRLCPAFTTCPAVERLGASTILPHLQNIRQVTEPILPAPKNLDLARLAYIIQVKPFVMKWLNAVAAHAEELERGGTDVPGVKMVETHGQRKYYGEEEAIAKGIAELAGVPLEQVYKRKLIGITEAEELIVEAFKSRVARNKRKKAAEDASQLFAFFTLKQPSGNLTLVPDDDPRPAVNKAQQTFQGISGLLPPPTT